MNWLKFILNLLPTILQLIVGIEAAIPGASGPAKKAVVIAMAKAVDPGTASQPFPEEKVGVVIDATVAALNTSGVFTKKTA